MSLSIIVFYTVKVIAVFVRSIIHDRKSALLCRDTLGLRTVKLELMTCLYHTCNKDDVLNAYYRFLMKPHTKIERFRFVQFFVTRGGLPCGSTTSTYDSRSASDVD